MSINKTGAILIFFQLMMTNANRGVFQITVDLKSLQIKLQLHVFIKLLQNVNSKWHFKNLRFYKKFSLTKY